MTRDPAGRGRPRHTQVYVRGLGGGTPVAPGRLHDAARVHRKAPDLASLAAGTVPVLVGSGARTGADIATALILCAQAVRPGRPHACGLALPGMPAARDPGPTSSPPDRGPYHPPRPTRP